MPESLTETPTTKEVQKNPFEEFLSEETSSPPSVRPLPSVEEVKGEDSEEEVKTSPELEEQERRDSLVEALVPAAEGRGGEVKETSKETTGEEDKPKASAAAEEVVQPAEGVKVSRNYEGLTVEETKIFKRLPNEAFNLLKPILLESKKLKEVPKEVPGFYDNEEAYTLTPEYKALSSNAQLASAVTAHWRKQFVLARSGKDYQELTNDAKGNLVLGETKTSGAEAEAEILANLQHAVEQERKFAEKVEALGTSHKQVVSQRKGVLADVEAKFFPMYKTPSASAAKLLENIGTDLNKLGVTPSNPAYNLLRKSAALNFEYQAIIKHLKSGAAVEQKQVASGPTSSHTSGGSAGAVPKPKVVSMADFEKLMADD